MPKIIRYYFLDAGIQLITSGQNCLKELKLRKLKITRKALTHVKSPYLEKVDFGGCNLLDDKGMDIYVLYSVSVLAADVS